MMSKRSIGTALLLLAACQTPHWAKAARTLVVSSPQFRGFHGDQCHQPDGIFPTSTI